MILGKEILEEHKIIEVKIVEVDIEVTLGVTIFEEVEVGPEKEQYSGNIKRNDRSSSGLRLGSRPSTNRDRIRCFKCREIQQMLNLEVDKMALKVFVTDNYKNLIRANSEETVDHLN